MGFRKIKFLRNVERRTYIRGSFFGKYRGNFDKTKSNSNYEEYYDINVYEGEIIGFEIEKDNPDEVNESEYVKFESEVHFLQKQFDNIISKPVNSQIDDFDVFKFKIDEPKIQNVQIDNVIKEDNQTFGTFTCTVFGYIVDVTEVEDELEVEFCDSCDNVITECTCQPIITITGTEKICKSCKKPIKECICVNEPIVTGRNNWGCLDFFNWIMVAAMILLGLSILFAVGLPGIIILGTIGAIILLFTYFSSIGNFVLKGIGYIFRLIIWLIGVGFVLSLIVGLFSLFTNSHTTHSTEKKEYKEEVVEEKVEPAPSDTSESVTIISHHRIWEDYDHNKYEGDLEVLKSDWYLSKRNRTNSNYQLRDDYSWSRLYNKMIQFDKGKLDRIYKMFNNIRVKQGLNTIEFAEMIVTCVQDIEYALVMDGSCNPTDYSDQDIRGLLDNCNSCCIGGVKYGIQSPVEFMANLKGDCDTRTVLLYTILSKFGYDVVVLGSIQYQHSILGINLPYHGQYKLHRGKKYYVWETTAYGIEPGLISPAQTNMNLWNIHLTSINN
jgi:hypothetical protein